MAIRLDGDPPAAAAQARKTINCPTPIHSAIKAKFVTTRSAAWRPDDLRFTVPPELLHPSGLDNASEHESPILKRGRQEEGQGQTKVGFYSAIGCKGGKRTIQATFTAEMASLRPRRREVLVA